MGGGVLSAGSAGSAGIGRDSGTPETVVAGDITLNATGSIKVSDGSGVYNIVFIPTNLVLGPLGNGSNITIDSGSFSLQDGAQLRTSTYGQGNAGNVTVRARDAVTLADADISTAVSAGGVGKGGNIDINAASLSLIDGAQLLTITREAFANQLAGRRDAGNVNVNVTGIVNIAGSFSGISSLVETGTVGNWGNITIDSGSFTLQDGAKIEASTFRQGNAGNVTVRARDAVTLADNASILSTIQPGNVGKGGNIDINAATLSIIDGSQLQTLTREAFATQPAGQGDAGNINVNVTGIVDIAGEKNGSVSGIRSFVNTGTVGNGGNITIDSGSFSLRDRAELVASTFGQGNAGNVTVRARGAVSHADNAAIFSTVEPGGVGKGGNIDINAATLSLIDGARLETITREASATAPAGRGDAGNVNINVTGSVNIAGEKNGFNSGIRSSVSAGTVGNGGNITIDSGSFSLRDRAVLTASTLGQGNAGNVNVNVTGVVDITGEKNGLPSGISSLVETGTVGNGGNITINSDSFSLRDGAQLTAETLGQGNAGIIKVNTADFFTISGKSSNLNISSGLFVNSQSPTGTAGDIIVTSPRVTLDNSGRLDAESASGNGGDISLQTDLLLLRRGAQITTTAGTALTGGDGGNIAINAPSGFIVAVPGENSDISGNAFTGKGGRVDIKAFGIYGIGFRESQTPLSDITASSEFGTQGTVELNTPGINPNSGLVNLPTVPVDTQLAQGCYSPGYAQNRFVITGRGGLPPNPKDILTPDATQIGWVPFKPHNNNRSLPLVTNKPTTKPTTSTPQRIVEATGAVLNAKGQIVLTANSSNVTSHTSRQNPIQCHGS
ncbi:S-layer family protein [Nostoc sp. XA010]|uniref:beta strand repeat-containing protein n=1 Tax=Nostoc sp. XA010 TaxID=2780407 RepID=UPI001E470AEF|nr:S-layer family protein [Nostoc sp. XA010]MCC5662326.1 S-layer family protein [Nostoc sp. XA010]